MRAAILFAAALFGALGSAGTAQAAEAGLSLSAPWFRLVTPSLPAAGYFTLSNLMATPRKLVGAASPACATLMLHQSIDQGGQERMVMVNSVPVPAQGKVSFAPGGYHLMCMSPTTAMRPGQSVPVTLRFADGGTLTARFPVRNATGK
jgi:periplasmic copper chaperone A